MMERFEAESGYIGNVAASDFVGSEMTGVEVLSVGGVNLLARGRRYGRQWLLKALRDDLRGSEAMRRQLMKEFEIHSRLSHPGIVQAVALEEIPGLGLCIVEEWIEGKTLSQLLRGGERPAPSGRLTKSERRRIMREVTVAVAYLHGKGVVHRDIKPSNIMVRDTGQGAVLIDFGLADTDGYVELKQPAGTPGFVSPEQAASGGARATDDVYSLGVLMRELCPDWRRLANRCTGPPASRPRDARALLKALDRREKRWRTVGIMSGIMALLIGIGYMSWRMVALGEAAQEADRKVTELTAENARQAEQSARVTAHAVQLSDSLTRVSKRMKEAEDEMNRQMEYAARLDRVTREGYRLIDRLVDRYDREVFGKLGVSRLEDFTRQQIRMQEELKDLIDSYCASQEVRRLNEGDRERLWADMHTHYHTLFTKYHEKWMKRVIPQQPQ